MLTDTVGAMADQRRDTRAPRRLLVLALVLLGAACGGTGDPVAEDPGGPATFATDIATELLAPLEGLGACGDQPEAVAPVDSVEGLHLPDGARLTSVSQDGPLVQVEGWVPLTPIGVRADYVSADNLEVLEIINVEDEIWESETLVTDGQHRLFVKAQGICRTESIFVAIVTAEDGSAPQPLGQDGS